MSAAEWINTTIGEQATLQRGMDITRAVQRSGTVPVISSGGVASYHDTSAASGPGVILGRKGVVGSVYFVASDYWPHDTTLWVRDFHGNNRRFVYYFFKWMAPRIASMDVGSANPTLNRNHVHPIEIRWPPLPEQRAIAHILGTLDDKIELNRRMNETLEAMARALFKSWFVDFDPVHAKAEGRDPDLPKDLADLFPASFENSERGEIPRGWSVGAFGDHMVNFDAKRVPVPGGERAKHQGPYPYHGAAGAMDYVDDYLFDGIFLLVGEDGSVVQSNGMAVTQYVWGKLWVNNHAHVLQGKGPVSTEQLYLYFHFESVMPYVTGAVQPKLSQGRMNTMPFVFAGTSVCLAFSKIIQPLFAKLRANADMSATLTALRDTLLPKLISGELRIKDAERFLYDRGL